MKKETSVRSPAQHPVQIPNAPAYLMSALWVLFTGVANHIERYLKQEMAECLFRVSLSIIFSSHTAGFRLEAAALLPLTPLQTLQTSASSTRTFAGPSPVPK